MTDAGGPPDPPGRMPEAGPSAPTTNRVWLLAAAYAVGTVALYLFAVRTGLGQRFDEAGFFGRDGAGPDLIDAEALLRGIEVTALIAALAVIAVIAYWRGRAPLAAGVVLLVVGANLTTQVLKQLVFERPHLVPDAYRLANSYPSGHVTAIASLMVALILVTSRPLRPLVALLASAAGVVVGIATVLAGWHRPSDVLGAWLVVGAWGAAVIASIRLTADTATSSPSGVGPRLVLWTLGGVAATAYLVAALVWMGMHWGDSDPGVRTVQHAAAVAAAVAGIVAGAIAVPASLVSAARRSPLAPTRLGRR